MVQIIVKKLHLIVKTLTKTQFENYLKTLNVEHDNGNTYLIGYGEVAIVNVLDCTQEIHDGDLIDGEEIRFTDGQKDELYSLAYEHGEDHLRGEADYRKSVLDDERHFSWLNENYR